MVAALVDELVDLLLPRNCVGCGAPSRGAALCLRCLRCDAPFQVPSGSHLDVFAAAGYDGPVRAALLRYKERGRRDLTHVLAELLARSVTALVESGSPGRSVMLVPVPSSRRAAAARGGDHVARLARRAGASIGLPSLRSVELTRTVRDSAGLAAPERARNIATAMAARPPPGAGCAAVIVDDIVTTGATLRETRRALVAVGWPVLGAAVVAATARAQ